MSAVWAGAGFATAWVGLRTHPEERAKAAFAFKQTQAPAATASAQIEGVSCFAALSVF